MKAAPCSLGGYARAVGGPSAPGAAWRTRMAVASAGRGAALRAPAPQRRAGRSARWGRCAGPAHRKVSGRHLWPLLQHGAGHAFTVSTSLVTGGCFGKSDLQAHVPQEKTGLDGNTGRAPSGASEAWLTAAPPAASAPWCCQSPAARLPGALTRPGERARQPTASQATRPGSSARPPRGHDSRWDNEPRSSRRGDEHQRGKAAQTELLSRGTPTAAK